MILRQPQTWVGFLCLLAVVCRIVFCLTSIDLENDNYWEYGEIAKNVFHGKGYSLFYYEGDTLQYLFNKAGNPHASAFMPPGYVFYLLPFLAVENLPLRNGLIFSGQIALQIAVLLMVFSFTRRYFSERAAIISAAVLAFSPDFIYATVSYTPTVFYHLTVIWLLVLLYDERNRTKGKTLAAISFLLATTMYFRSESSFFAVIVLLSFLAHKNRKGLLVVGSMAVFLMLPWLIRNATVFGLTCVPLTTNFGQNFYRGHNPYFVGKFPDEEMNRQAKVFDHTEAFEMELNRLYLHDALECIQDQPVRELKNSLAKIFHLWLFNPSEPRTQHAVYFVPWFFLFVFFLLGVVKSFSWQRHSYSYLFFLYSTLIAVLFFAIPRYQTMMKIAMIPFAGNGAEIFLNFLQNRFHAVGLDRLPRIRRGGSL